VLGEFLGLRGVWVPVRNLYIWGFACIDKKHEGKSLRFGFHFISLVMLVGNNYKTERVVSKVCLLHTSEVGNKTKQTT